MIQRLLFVEHLPVMCLRTQNVYSRILCIAHSICNTIESIRKHMCVCNLYISYIFSMYSYASHIVQCKIKISMPHLSLFLLIFFRFRKIFLYFSFSFLSLLSFRGSVSFRLYCKDIFQNKTYFLIF
jgi:hypothetical protein